MDIIFVEEMIIHLLKEVLFRDFSPVDSKGHNNISFIILISLEASVVQLTEDTTGSP